MSKGLEFPLVYVPYAWGLHVPDDAVVQRHLGPDGTRIRDVGGSEGANWASALRAGRE